ncbi:MAG: DUF1302 domain-containing protein [bacterium]
MQRVTRLLPGVFRRHPRPLLVACAVILACTAFAPPAAFPIQFNVGSIEGSLDTTVSTGASVRVGERNPELIAVSNGGKANTANGDDGNLNFGQWDLVSLNAKVLHELDLSWKNFGFFGRMYYFYDWAIMEIDPERTAFSESAQRRAGMNIKFLDAYLKGDFELAGQPLTLRVGNQVLNWGESTFIQNGISVINPVDVSVLRVAGAELKEALLPVPMINLSAGITNNLSIEGFYQFYWDNTEIEPNGTFFSTTDFFSPGGSRAFLAFGKNPPDGPKDYPATEVDAPLGPYFSRLGDDEPDDQGQGGAALRYFAPWLNETEFGVYYVRFHSRLPLANGRTGPPPPITADPQTAEEVIALLEYGLANGDYAKTAGLYRTFPEGLQLVGGSFSTDLPFGIAAQGEVSYHWDQPIQVDDVELSFATLSPMDPFLNTLAGLQATLAGQEPPPPGPIFGNSQLGAQDFNQDVKGYRRKEYVQPQLTLTKIFGPTLGTDQIVLLGEVGADWFFGMEAKSKLRYEGPGTFTSANPVYLEDSGTVASLVEMPGVTAGGFADDFSWGYRIATRVDFNNAIGPVNLKPSVAFSHDVNGTTPSPIGNFVEDRKTVTATLTAEYLNMLRAAVSYTNYFDGGQRNLLNDRDFVSVAASLSF